MSSYFCSYSKLLEQTLKQASNVQIKDKAPEISKEIKNK